MKDPLTLAGIEPATFRIVAQHLSHCATADPIYIYIYREREIIYMYIYIERDYIYIERERDHIYIQRERDHIYIEREIIYIYIYIYNIYVMCDKNCRSIVQQFWNRCLYASDVVRSSPEAKIKLDFLVLFDPPRSERFNFEVPVQLYINLSSEVCNSLFICRKLNIRTFNNVPFVPVL